MYSTAVSLYHKMPEHTDTFSTSLHDSKNSVAAQIRLSCTRPLTNGPDGQLQYSGQISNCDSSDLRNQFPCSPRLHIRPDALSRLARPLPRLSVRRLSNSLYHILTHKIVAVPSQYPFTTRRWISAGGMFSESRYLLRLEEKVSECRCCYPSNERPNERINEWMDGWSDIFVTCCKLPLLLVLPPIEKITPD